MNRATLRLKIVNHLRKRGATTTVDMSDLWDIPRATLQVAIRELRESGVLEPEAQGALGGIKLACSEGELTCGKVLGDVGFVNPKAHIDKLP